MDEVILELLGLLKKISSERGVPETDDISSKNIANDDNNKNQVLSSLKNNEKKKLQETFTIFNKLFFDQQRKFLGDDKEKTLISDIAQTQEPKQKIVDKKESGGGILSMLLGGLALLGASIGGIIASLSGFFGDTGSKVLEAVSKLGFMGALKLLSKTILEKLSMQVLKKLPFIGGIIGLYFAYQAFKQGNIFKGISELISALLNFIPGIGPILSIGADLLIAWADSKGVFSEGGALSPENGWKTIKGWMSNIGKTIMDNALYLPIIGTFKRFGMAIESFKSGNIGEGLKQIGLGLFTMIPGGGLLIKGIEILSGFLNSDKSQEPTINADSSWGTRIMGWVRSKLKDLPWFIKKPLAWFGIISDDQVGEPDGSWGSITDGVKKGFESTKEFVGGIWDKVKGPMGDAVGVIGQFATDAWSNTKDYASKAWDSVKEQAPLIWDSIKTTSKEAWDIVTEYAPKAWDSIKDVSSKAWDVTKNAGSWFSETISEMATKTKDLIDGWIPKIVDTISGITDGAMKVLKSIADKIGGWISGLFSSEDQSKLKEVTAQASEKKELISNTSASNANMENMVRGSIVQNQWMENLYKSSLDQVKLLGNLVNIGSSSLQELKRMSGNNSGGGTTIIQQSSSSPEKTPLIPVGNNRSGFSSSPYALA